MDMRAGSRPRLSMNFHNDRDYNRDRDRTYYRDRHYRDRDYERDRDRDYEPPRHRSKPFPKRYTSRDVDIVPVLPVVHPFSVASPPKGRNSPHIIIIPASAASSFPENQATSSLSSSTGSSVGKQIIIESIPSHLVTASPLEAPSTSLPAVQTPMPVLMKQIMSVPSSSKASSQQHLSSGTTVVILASESSSIPRRQQLSHEERQSHDSRSLRNYSSTESTSQGISRTETDSRQDSFFESTTKDLSERSSTTDTFDAANNVKDITTVLDSNHGKKFLKFTMLMSDSQGALIPPTLKLHSHKEKNNTTQDNDLRLQMTDTTSSNSTESNLADFFQQQELSSFNRKDIVAESQMNGTQSRAGENISITEEEKNRNGHISDQMPSYTLEVIDNVTMSPISSLSKGKDIAITKSTMSSTVSSIMSEEHQVEITEENTAQSSLTSNESAAVLSSSLSSYPDFL